LGIALTDTFGTKAFLESFKQSIKGTDRSFAKVFSGVRQDSGDPVEFVKMIRKFYTEQGIKNGKIVTFSDSLDVEKCLHYKEETEKLDLLPRFGVGTFFTSKY
jgi:nicotinate phosphoribosyltransferase